MAVMAPRVLLRERGSSMRRAAVTGSLVGAAADAAGGVDAAGVFSCPTATVTPMNTERSTRACFTRVLLKFFRNQRTNRSQGSLASQSSKASRERCANRRTKQREEYPPPEDKATSRPPFYLPTTHTTDLDY